MNKPQTTLYRSFPVGDDGAPSHNTDDKWVALKVEGDDDAVQAFMRFLQLDDVDDDADGEGQLFLTKLFGRS